jgi:hypothetical protein
LATGHSLFLKSLAIAFRVAYHATHLSTWRCQFKQGCGLQCDPYI